MSNDGSSYLFSKAPRGLDRNRLRRFQSRLSNEVAGGSGFNCLLTSDQQMQALNAEFLGYNYPTDVLSFPTANDGPFLGEIAISVNRAAEQALEYGHPLETEIEILMLHGLLHLMGHDHEQDRGRMRRLEKKWRLILDLPTGLIERSRR